MEKDDELKGEGNAINYEARFFDPRVGRFLSLDPLSKKFPMLSPFQFASNTPIWAVDLDGLEARVYTDLSAIPHSFISVIDKDGVINVFTFGQYGQKGNGLGGLYNTGSALVHLKGDDANNYIKHEFENYSMGVYEISKEVVNKQEVIDYYAKEMQTYNIPAEKIDKHAPVYVNEENGSKAVKYKPYWLTPTGGDNENCTSIVNDGLKAGGVDTVMPAVPWLMNEGLWRESLMNPNVKNVTIDTEKGAKVNRNGSLNKPTKVESSPKTKQKTKSK
jgi:RHS repeat-associated protein